MLIQKLGMKIFRCLVYCNTGLSPLWSTPILITTREIIINPGHVVYMLQTMRSVLQLTTAGGRQCSSRQLMTPHDTNAVTINLSRAFRS